MKDFLRRHKKQIGSVVVTIVLGTVMMGAVAYQSGGTDQLLPTIQRRISNLVRAMQEKDGRKVYLAFQDLFSNVRRHARIRDFFTLDFSNRADLSEEIKETFQKWKTEMGDPAKMTESNVQKMTDELQEVVSKAGVWVQVQELTQKMANRDNQRFKCPLSDPDCYQKDPESYQPPPFDPSASLSIKTTEVDDSNFLWGFHRS